MKCPYCSALDTKVIDSRLNQLGDMTRRRRECPRCEGRFTTYERVEEVMPAVIKKDGRREPFARQKVLDGVQKACQKRSIPTQKVEELVSRIEKRIQSFGLKEVPARTVGQMVMIELHNLDKVAYVRFSSVYREFQDVEEFVAELQELPPVQDDPSSLTFAFAGSNGAAATAAAAPSASAVPVASAPPPSDKAPGGGAGDNRSTPKPKEVVSP